MPDPPVVGPAAGVSLCGVKVLTLPSATGRGSAARSRSAPTRPAAARSRPRSRPPSELPVDAGEPQVRHLVELAQRSEDRDADLVGRAPPAGRTARSESSTSWPSRASWSSLTGRPLQALRTPLITLSRLNGSTTPLRLTTTELHLLDGGEPPLADRALPPAADARAVLGDPGVEHLGVGVTAVRAVHLDSSSLGVLGCPRTGLGTTLGTACGSLLWISVGNRPQPVDEPHPCNY